MVQMSWTFVNDSLCTTLCLQWEPEIIAIAVMYLAAKLSKFEVIQFEIKYMVHGVIKILCYSVVLECFILGNLISI